jgi:hypothetical protein
MPDKILESFLERQFDEGMSLAAASDSLKLAALDAQHYLAVFDCKGLVMGPGGEIQPSDHFEAGIYFAPNHLRRLDPPSVVTWIGPLNIWHPNVRPPFVCLGHMTAGVGLVEIIYQLHEIVTWRRFTAHDALNWDAATWANRNRHRFPVDDRPLKRQRLALTFREKEAEA